MLCVVELAHGFLVSEAVEPLNPRVKRQEGYNPAPRPAKTQMHCLAIAGILLSQYVTIDHSSR